MSVADSMPAGFRAIPGFPRYAINESGVVLSICGHGFGAGTNLPWADAKQIKPTTGTGGYQFVSLRHDGRTSRASVHALVITTFVGPCPLGMQCRHLDGNRTNNHVSNLAWGTPLENQHDRIRHGTNNKGSNVCTSKLTDNDVLEIRRRAANGESKVDIAKDFPVNPPNISHIVLRRSWKHI